MQTVAAEEQELELRLIGDAKNAKTAQQFVDLYLSKYTRISPEAVVRVAI